MTREVGLAIGDTFITNNKSNLIEHYKNNKVITKAIEDNIAVNHQNRLIIQRVQRVDYNEIEDLFFPSLFQNEIDKDIEIRIFYLDKKCYSISFKPSSLDNIDMRDNYAKSEYDKFKLPNEIEGKIIKLMDRLKLVSGSLDFIKSKDGIFYFLEVNLNGQYDWVSHYGGYNLHQKIANFLVQKENAFCKKHSLIKYKNIE
jgi:hypothetical protein